MWRGGSTKDKGSQFISYNLRTVLQKYFCTVYDYARKVDLSKSYRNPKRKLGVTMHFSEMIMQQ